MKLRLSAKVLGLLVSGLAFIAAVGGAGLGATSSMAALVGDYAQTKVPQLVAISRLATAVVKYWVCKRTPMLVAEALECLGGNGYVEESMMPRLYREAPLNSIWEGSGNVICLDVLRAMTRGPETVEAFFGEVERARGADARLDAHVARMRAALDDPVDLESRARGIVEGLALALGGALLVQHGDAAVAEAFCASRLAGEHGLAFGTLLAHAQLARIVERARPAVG